MRAPATSGELATQSGLRDPKDRPLVSFVLPCYREPLPILERTLDSVLAQTYTNIEIVVVVDDPANQAMVELLRARAEVDRRLRIVVNEHNLGAWPSYNRGVREARGEIIAIQDADDTCDPSRVEVLASYLLQNPSIGVVGSALTYVDAASGQPLLLRSYPADPGQAIRRYCPLAHGTTLRRSTLFAAHGLYDESPRYRHAADYELWCRWYSGGVRMANVPDALYTYYQSSSNFKAQNVKAILRDTVRIKARYARALHFGIGDYLWLAAETVGSVLPGRIVVAAFYTVNRWRSRRMAPLDLVSNNHV